MDEAAPPLSGAPTLEDVARVAGVSRATVSRVVNGTRNVDPLIQAAVREAITTTSYAPNRAARSLATKRSGNIALVISGAGSTPSASVDSAADPFFSRVFSDPFFGRVATGVVRFLRTHGIHPILMLADTDATRAEICDYVRQGNADGALIVSTHAEDPLPALFADAHLPAVLFARPARPIPIGYVDLAHHAGAALAADHLVARGRRQVGTISGPLDVPASQDRLTGFRDAMTRHGHPYIPIAEGNFDQDSGEKAMQRLLAEHPHLDGVFAANDLMAQGALLALHRHNRRVPDDIALVGFDDSSAALACRPPLTTVRQPIEEMAAEMARLLLSQIAQPGEMPRPVIFEPTLVIRQST